MLTKNKLCSYACKRVPFDATFFKLFHLMLFIKY